METNNELSGNISFAQDVASIREPSFDGEVVRFHILSAQGDIQIELRPENQILNGSFNTPQGNFDATATRQQ